MKSRVAVAVLIALTVGACAKSEPPAAPRPSAGSGVSVDTGRDVLPLSTFSLGIAHALPVRNTPHAVPTVASVRAFIVNVPNASGSDMKLYWVRDLDLIFSENQAPIAAQVKQRDGSIYEISPPNLAEKGGYLMLVMTSPHGGPSRYYAVALRS